MQILKSKYDMGYLAPTWLGKRWQPFYQELLDLAGITSMAHICSMHTQFAAYTVECRKSSLYVVHITASDSCGTLVLA